MKLACIRRGATLGIAIWAATGCATLPAQPDQTGPPRIRDKPLTGPAVSRKLKVQRQAAALRRRRIIFNNDGNEPVYLLKEATADALLESRTRGLLGSQVDSIFYCTWSSGFGYFTHDTRVGHLFTSTENRLKDNLTKQLIANGIDPLKVMVDFAHANGIELFWSLRMNDAHDAHDAWYSPLLMSPFKVEHPEWMVGSTDHRPVNGRWSTVDYALPEVRDLAFRFVEEVVTNYDVDGIQLDFFRDPALFRSVAWGEPASLEELDLFTRWMERVRTLAEDVGEARGRPLLIAVRVPDSLDYAWKIGLDVERWLAQDLVDLLIVGGYFRLEPWESSVSLGRRYSVPVYADLSDSRQRDKEARSVYASMPALRGRAINAWHAGVDGIHMFNAFGAQSVLWHQVGDPELLGRMDNVHITSARGYDSVRLWWRDGERYMRRDIVSPDRPRRLKTDAPESVVMPVGEDTGDAVTTLKIRVADLAEEAQIEVALNGMTPIVLTGSGHWRSAVFPVGQVVAGNNAFMFTLRGPRRGDTRIEDLHLHVCRSCRSGQ